MLINAYTAIIMQTKQLKDLLFCHGICGLSELLNQEIVFQVFLPSQREFPCMKLLSTSRPLAHHWNNKGAHGDNRLSPLETMGSGSCMTNRLGQAPVAWFDTHHKSKGSRRQNSV